jgi:ATP-binding cassette subfamily B protein
MGLLAPHSRLVMALLALTLAGNGLTLMVPWLVSRAIDAYQAGTLVVDAALRNLLIVSLGICAFTYLQSVVQTYASEIVARDLRAKLMAKISVQGHAFIQDISPSVLLTHLTSDVDAVKLFVSQAVASLIASVFLIIGASVLLLSIDVTLALSVLGIVPVIGVTFFLVLKRVRPLFLKGQEAIDWLNKVINESILGAMLIRLLDSQAHEHRKFATANAESREIGLRILRLFAGLIPVIVFATNVATLLILVLGGRFVIAASMTLGEFLAFNSYLSILVFPIIMIGFMSNVMAQAGASYQRLSRVLDAPDAQEPGTLRAQLRGEVALEHVTLSLGGKEVLKDVSFSAATGTRTAVIGPTGAGKTQLLYLLARLVRPGSGTVRYDGLDVDAYDAETLRGQVGLVFQDSAVFNLTLRENIAFSRTVTDDDLRRALRTAELTEFVEALPSGLDTVVSERGTSLSGGQKQRLMLARALAINPRVLLLDDFTARVDVNTANLILENVHREYPGLTLVSVTQQIAPVEGYDQIVLLMEGEVLASGTHQTLLDTSPEYAQIHESQRSTSHYESLSAR